MHKINIKPLSVNKAWQGRRFKSKAYIQYERDLLYLLPKGINLPKESKIALQLKFGLSSRASDIDNPAKQCIDCMVRKYGFDDKQIYWLLLEKEIVKKGKEFIEFEINKL